MHSHSGGLVCCFGSMLVHMEHAQILNRNCMANAAQQELEVNSESLRLELQTCLSHKLSAMASKNWL